MSEKIALQMSWVLWRFTTNHRESTEDLMLFTEAVCVLGVSLACNSACFAFGALVCLLFFFKFVLKLKGQKVRACSRARNIFITEGVGEKGKGSMFFCLAVLVWVCFLVVR